jgi:hypothetical protein
MQLWARASLCVISLLCEQSLPRTPSWLKNLCGKNKMPFILLSCPAENCANQRQFVPIRVDLSWAKPNGFVAKIRVPSRSDTTTLDSTFSTLHSLPPCPLWLIFFHYLLDLCWKTGTFWYNTNSSGRQISPEAGRMRRTARFRISRYKHAKLHL